LDKEMCSFTPGAEQLHAFMQAMEWLAEEKDLGVTLCTGSAWDGDTWMLAG